MFGAKILPLFPRVMRDTAALLTVVLALFVGTAWAQDSSVKQLESSWFGLPADELEVLTDSELPSIFTVTHKGRVVGWIGSSYALVNSTGYSGKPLDIDVAVNTEGRVAGARLIRQSEPILTIGVTDEDLENYVSSFVGIDLALSLATLRDAGAVPDAVSGATVSSGVIRDAVIRTGRTILSVVTAANAGDIRVDRVNFAESDWENLIALSAVTTKTLTFAQLRDQMPKAIGLPSGDGTFSQLTIGLATPPTIGRNLIGRRNYERLMAQFSGRDQLLFLAGNGLFSFKGANWRKSGVFDRIEIVQNAKTIRLAAEDHHSIPKILASGAPEFREAAVFRIDPSTGFQATEPFRVDLIVTRSTESGEAVYRFPIDYQIPETFVIKPPSMPPAAASSDDPLWMDNWYQRIPDLVFLGILLVVLTGVMFISDPIVKRPKLYMGIRVSFLVIVVVWVGWIAGAQLSVVHVFTFAGSLLGEFNWEVFLLDPLIFLLWGGVAMGLLFWGRGVFCGWLCPFGALQELINLVAKRLGIKQIEIPFMVHERLWSIKYIIFICLFGLSLYSVELAFKVAEIEPFKTAITLKFMRSWPYVLYAAALLAAGLFIERFFCRYLCPLGAALALPAKLKLFDWLQRRPQCGRECRVCATKCTVQAIHPLGQINPNECIYCLRCQMIYNNDHICVPLKMRARRRGGLDRPPAPSAPPAKT